MTFKGIAHPEQLAILRSVLDDHCQEFGFEEGSHERSLVAHEIMSLFERGMLLADDLKAALVPIKRKA